MTYVLPFVFVTFGGAVVGLWLIRRWSARDLGRVGHAVRALVLLTLVSFGAFLLASTLVGVRAAWVVYAVAAAIACGAVYRATKQQKAFNDALVAHNTAMAGDAEMPPNPTPEELLQRMADGLKRRRAERKRVLRELREKKRR